MGAWLVAGLGLLACLFGIVLAIIPPAQVAEEVGSPVTYVVVIVAIIVVTFAICFGVYQAPSAIIGPTRTMCLRRSPGRSRV